MRAWRADFLERAPEWSGYERLGTAAHGEDWNTNRPDEELACRRRKRQKQLRGSGLGRPDWLGDGGNRALADEEYLEQV